MKTATAHILWLVSALSLLAAGPTALNAQPIAVDLTGIWRGDIDPEGGALELVFHIAKRRDGSWTGTVDTPAQNSFALPVSKITIAQDGAIALAVGATQGLYEARLAADGKTLRGTWKQRGAELTLDCVREPLPPPLPRELTTALAGRWEGRLAIGSIRLRLVVQLAVDEHGALSGFMMSPDQSPAELAVTRVDAVDAQRVRICVGTAFTSFEMSLQEGGDALSGSFTQGRSRFDLTLEKKTRATAVHRPQEPKPPFPYRTEEVTYENSSAGVSFAGTLSLPEGPGPFPAVLLITGSGSQDRDETIFQHRPFLVVADHLARRGIASLRVDDRGVGRTTRGNDLENATTADFVGDAQCGVEFLKGRSEIAGDRIGLIGHSEGGVIAPIAASQNGDIAFIILLAGPGVRGDRLLLKQNELISSASGVDAEELTRGLALSKALFEVVLDERLGVRERLSRLEALMRESPDLAEGEEGADAIAKAIAELEQPWMRWFIRYDPAPTLAKVTCPVLAINGTLDLQVPCSDNLEAIRAALERGKNPDFELVAMPRLNHLFQTCETGSPSEYGEIEETFSVEVLDTMARWIGKRFSPKK